MPEQHIHPAPLTRVYLTAKDCLHFTLHVAAAIGGKAETFTPFEGWPDTQRGARHKCDAIKAEVDPTAMLWWAAAQKAGVSAALRASSDGHSFDSHVTRIIRLARFILELSIDDRALTHAPLNWKTLRRDEEWFSRPHYAWLRDAAADEGVEYARLIKLELDTAQGIYAERQRLENEPLDALQRQARSTGRFPPLLVSADIHEPGKLTAIERCSRLRDNMQSLQSTLHAHFARYMDLSRRSTFERNEDDCRIYGQLRAELRQATFTRSDIAMLALSIAPTLAERLKVIRIDGVPCFAMNPDAIDIKQAMSELELIGQHADLEYAKLRVTPATLPQAAVLDLARETDSEGQPECFTRAELLAFSQYNRACKDGGCVGRKEALAWLKKNDDGFSPASDNAWLKAVQRAAVKMGTQLKTPRGSRPARSVVRHSDIG